MYLNFLRHSRFKEIPVKQKTPSFVVRAVSKDSKGMSTIENDDCFVFGMLKEKVDTVVQDAITDVLDGKAFEESKVHF